MHLMVAAVAKPALRHIAVDNRPFAATFNEASEPQAIEFAESDGMGSAGITADGRQLLSDMDHGVQF